MDEILTISDRGSYNKANRDFWYDPIDSGDNLVIYIYDDKPLSYQLKNKESFRKCIDYNIKEYPHDFTGRKHAEDIYYNFDNLPDMVNAVRLLFDKTNIFEFIKENPWLEKKELLLEGKYQIYDIEKLKKELEKYKGIKNDIGVWLEGNYEYVNVDECLKSMELIKSQADYIRSLKLSPMEEIMIAYDNVRNRVYKYEDKDQCITESRDLSKVLLGEKIVCLGYSNIFDAVLKYLGYTSKVIKLLPVDENEKGHARCLVYVNDPKYDIDGAYFFDPTYDSKKDNEDATYLSKYRFFGLTKQQIDSYKNDNFRYDNKNKINLDVCDEIKSAIKENRITELINFHKDVNYLSNLVLNKNLISTPEVFTNREYFKSDEFMKVLEYLFSRFDNPISGEKLIMLTNNVRKIEYYLDPKTFNYDINELYHIYIRSKWELKGKYMSPEQRLMAALFSKKVSITEKDNFVNFIKTTSISREIAGVKLANSIREAYNNKTRR